MVRKYFYCTPTTILLFQYVLVPAVSAEAFKTSRGCVSYSDLKELEAAQPIIGIIEFCDIDGCNGSVTLQSSAAVMIFTAVARCLYYGFRWKSQTPRNTAFAQKSRTKYYFVTDYYHNYYGSVNVFLSFGAILACSVYGIKLQKCYINKLFKIVNYLYK